MSGARRVEGGAQRVGVRRRLGGPGSDWPRRAARHACPASSAPQSDTGCWRTRCARETLRRGRARARPVHRQRRAGDHRGAQRGAARSPRSTSRAGPCSPRGSTRASTASACARCAATCSPRWPASGSTSSSPTRLTSRRRRRAAARGRAARGRPARRPGAARPDLPEAPRTCAGGVLLVVHSSLIGAEDTLERLLTRHGLTPSVLVRRHGPLGPLLSARAPALEAKGMLEPGDRTGGHPRGGRPSLVSRH